MTEIMGYFGGPARWEVWMCCCLGLGAVVGCGEADPQPAVSLRVAVTTSTRDSGLLDAIVPPYETSAGVRVDIVAVGTGRALQLGRAGDVDVVFVHARAAEDAFMRDGDGVRREDVMYNTFELLGPTGDPVAIGGSDVLPALRRIATAGAPFVSRGDSSGTHQRELALWQAVGGRPAWSGFVESGQGMGPSLLMAHEMQAYILSDRGTFLSMRSKLDLVPLTAPSPLLENPYGIIVVKTDHRQQLQRAHEFVDYMISAPTQRQIADYRVDGQVLFHPLRLRTEP
ncbi:MAG: substrate-binding domain-containing protein [bacterium]|nr:substrate-binding domain-containing protein [bacterium]